MSGGLAEERQPLVPPALDPLVLSPDDSSKAGLLPATLPRAGSNTLSVPRRSERRHAGGLRGLSVARAVSQRDSDRRGAPPPLAWADSVHRHLWATRIPLATASTNGAARVVPRQPVLEYRISRKAGTSDYAVRLNLLRASTADSETAAQARSRGGFNLLEIKELWSRRADSNR